MNNAHHPTQCAAHVVHQIGLHTTLYNLRRSHEINGHDDRTTIKRGGYEPE
ncbi:MAG: hypothetical protein HXS54_02105 [Theionarchaea archaeon]|nr:hypothetical protein [Theionarchaea archaeon]